MNYLTAFQKEASLIAKLGLGNAYLVWAMALYLDQPDPEELAAESLTDGTEDKKIDFIRFDQDLKRIVFAQGYYSDRKVDRAPANKASDLNTASAWLISGDLSMIPPPLTEIMAECRKALEDGEIEQIELLFVHNLPESANVANELNTAAAYLAGQLRFPVSVVARELGVEALERLYSARESAIHIKDSLVCPSPILFEEEGPNWKAATLSVPATWLRELFLKHGENLFSANYRGFLGISKRRKINTGIRQTAENEPANFWVFNNGITILTMGYKRETSSTKLNGISIINGAQTTGSIGSTDSSKHPLANVKVLCRIIESNDAGTISQIVRFNNTQNEITTWDQYSNDETQKRIAKEFADFGHDYSLKRGFGEGQGTLGIEQVAGPILALEGKFQDANRGKNLIFERTALYREAFQDKKARHILFAYSLGKAIDERRIQLKEKKRSDTLIEIEARQLELFRNLRFKNFLMALIGRTLETLLGKPVTITEIGFDPKTSRALIFTLPELAALWIPVVGVVTAQVAALVKGSITDVMAEDGALEDMANQVKGLIYARETLI